MWLNVNTVVIVRQKDESMITIQKLTKHFDCSEEERVALQHLIAEGEQTVFSLSKFTQIKRTTLYGVLEKLLHKGLVVQINKGGAQRFAIATKEKIEKLLSEKIDEISIVKGTLSQMIENIKTNSTAPELQVYEGVEGVKHILRDLTLRSNIETEAFWPIKKMLETLSPEYFEQLNKERIKRNIYTRAIWPQSQIVDTKKFPYLGSGEEFLRDVRVAPKQIDFSMGYWIYGDSVAMLSSKKEMFGFIIRSAEFADMMRKQFNLVWGLSRPFKQKTSPEVEDFLKTVFRK